MDTILSAIDYKDPIWIAIAFLFGALSKALGLPPLIGFLVAGFVLNYIGVEAGYFLNEMANLGILLLLFTIGLKLKIKELLKIQVWGSALTHMVIFTAVSLSFLMLLKQLNLPLFNTLSLVNAIIISFALSFSSTVFVVKALDEHGDFLSRYGQIAIGILIIQDLVAVLYLGVSAGKVPTIWAPVLLLSLFIIRPLMIKLSAVIGHGELLLLFGLVVAYGGASLFEAVDMKADLGALVFGILLANTPKADELSKALLNVKELFLVGFFLSIGMSGLPNATTFMAAFILIPLLLIKSSLFFWLLSQFKERTFSASKASLRLSNYSEFGLIVIIVAVSQGWVSKDWLVVMAVLIAISFIISSVLTKYSDAFYYRFETKLKKFQHPSLSEKEFNIDLSNVHILVCGMGHLGTGAYDELVENNNVIGFDFDEDIVAEQTKQGRITHYANVDDSDFWAQLDIKNSAIEWILLSATNVDANKTAASFARHWGFKGTISATAMFPDEKEALIASGVDTVYNIYDEAGAGLALHGQSTLIASDKLHFTD